jgi:hypothetical protein
MELPKLRTVSSMYEHELHTIYVHTYYTVLKGLIHEFGGTAPSKIPFEDTFFYCEHSAPKGVANALDECSCSHLCEFVCSNVESENSARKRIAHALDEWSRL